MPGKITLIGLLAGLSVTSGLLVWSGFDQVLAILTTAGWSLLLVILLAPPEALLASEAWRCLFPVGRRPKLWPTLRASWIGMAVNTLLPVATIGGEIVKARVLMLSGPAPSDVAAATIVDKTVQAIVILVWGLIGIAILAALTPDERILWGGLIAAMALAFGIGGFVAVQLLGSFSFLAGASARLMRGFRGPGWTSAGAVLDQAIRDVYRRPIVIAQACGLRLASQLWLVSEVLSTTYLLGHAIGLEQAIILRALISAVRGLSFLVPAGLGLQEGAYIALGSLMGSPADVMLALSLASRLREIGPAVPLLLLWQQLEGRTLWRRHKARDAGHKATSGFMSDDENSASDPGLDGAAASGSPRNEQLDIRGGAHA